MNFLMLSAAALLLIAPMVAHPATVSVTIGNGGAMEADLDAIEASGVKVETFDSLGAGEFVNFESELGTYSAGRVIPGNRYGGADESPYLFSQSNPGSTLVLNSTASYFGLWWSAGSVGNSVELISNGSSIFVFNTDDVLAFLDSNIADAADFFGNPNEGFKDQVSHEPFVFLNMFSDQPFDTVRFSGPNFESDNHTVAESFTNEVGLSIAPVPVPATLPLLAASVGGLVFCARRRKPSDNA